MKDIILKDLNSKSHIINNLDIKKLIDISKIFKNAINNKRLFFTCGNGGSASTADHVACDYLKRFKKFKSAIRIISLSSNSSTLTAMGNDVNFNQIYSEQIQCLAKRGDILIIFSVSGNSKNLLEAAKISKKKGLKIISFTGNKGGKLFKLSNICINLNSKNYGLVEDIHLSLTHLLSDYILGKKNIIK
ncbi:SIS domain-containing protein [Candidatus Pelagibacter communis]|uniref:Phosphoheptose isomerase NMA0340 n=2 Tax=Pelagibacter ubique TaxID=198252 RepID=Q4FN73_PELUB|nr:SIS domain-containing protein [Candidatus Pelagibacter ubique]AAZ21366.1 phosphoheptose isomerase NMA0340 [Candidatus Pelagibacter ubique HTCC1062]EAS84772.1 phosphoheptose isomerase [Candidatus Pelagibacter ubique HTCC1002]